MSERTFTIKKTHLAAVVVSVVIVIAAFLPWLHANALVWSLTLSGIDMEEGYITLCLGLGAMLVVALEAYGLDRERWPAPTVMLLGFGVAGVGGYDWVDIESAAIDSGVEGLMTVGTGLVLTTLAGFALAGVGMWMIHMNGKEKDAPRPPESEVSA